MLTRRGGVMAVCRGVLSCEAGRQIDKAYLPEAAPDLLRGVSLLLLASGIHDAIGAACRGVLSWKTLEAWKTLEDMTTANAA